MKGLILLTLMVAVGLVKAMPMSGEGATCRIYHGIYGKCKSECSDPDDKIMHGMGVCKGLLCCYKGYGQRSEIVPVPI